MRSTILWLTLLGVAFAGEGKSTRWDFENGTSDQLAPHWTIAKTGEGQGSVWKIVVDETAPQGKKVLAQTSSGGSGAEFNVCVADEPKLTDLDLTLSFKAVTGTTDQGGGPVWRFQDAKNYYVARMNPLEDNFRVYKVVDGNRTQLATATIEAPVNKWHTIRVVQKGNKIRCYLNGKLHLEATDDRFKSAGKIGLWTKADAVTYFDNLQIAKQVE